MNEHAKADAAGGAGFVGRIDFRRSRSGNRMWPKELKGRIVRESLAPGVRVADVARKYGMCAQQLTTWRRAARSGRLALVADDAAEFVAIELSEPPVRTKSLRRSRSRLARLCCGWKSDTASTRVAEIVSALERGA